jgi:NAD-dependent dihydropyrimidine dehydrogenase PreA subunit
MGVKLGDSRLEILSAGRVVIEPNRCVQCGVCAYNCPVGIDVRNYSWQRLPVNENKCLLCGQCVARCPRGVLRFERQALVSAAQ